MLLRKNTTAVTTRISIWIQSARRLDMAQPGVYCNVFDGRNNNVWPPRPSHIEQAANGQLISCILLAVLLRTDIHGQGHMLIISLLRLLLYYSSSSNSRRHSFAKNTTTISIMSSSSQLGASPLHGTAAAVQHAVCILYIYVAAARNIFF